MKRSLLLSLLVMPILFLSWSNRAAGQEPTVRAVLFYSPTCPHCELVLREVLPPLMQHYGDQLQIIAIPTNNLEGHALYSAALERYAVPEERRGVPTLIVGDTVLVGSGEIPAWFPALIEGHLASGGVDSPDIPGLVEVISEIYPGEAEQPESSDPEQSAVIAHAASIPETSQETGYQRTALDRFKQDIVGNSISVLVLTGMLASLGYTAIRFIQRLRNRYPAGDVPIWKARAVAALSLLGLGVACYLAYVETTQTLAVCGPIGDCNTVQQSEYARLFGFLPIGVLGAAGYVLVLVGWLAVIRMQGILNKWAGLAVFGIALSGTLFSIYLTFLEPFVIGATCAWCLTSAVIMTSIVVLTVDIGATALTGITGSGTQRRNTATRRLPRRMPNG